MIWEGNSWPDREDFRDLIGGDYKSERFDAESINWELVKHLRWSQDRYQNWERTE